MHSTVTFPLGIGITLINVPIAASANNKLYDELIVYNPKNLIIEKEETSFDNWDKVKGLYSNKFKKEVNTLLR